MVVPSDGMRLWGVSLRKRDVGCGHDQEEQGWVPKGNGEGQSMFGQFWARHHGEARQGSVLKRAGREGGK